MKIKTVGALAGLAMTVTSATVWSVTPAGGFSERLAAPARVVGIAAPELALDGWKFSDGDTVRLEGRLGHATLAADRDQETYLYLHAEAPSSLAATQAAPLDLAIVIDRSGSMAGKKLQNALEAARGMVRRLRDGDVVSIITYDTQTETLVSPTVIGPGNRERVAGALDRVSLGGDTCISCAIDAGMRALQDPVAEGMVKRVLLLSDGRATAGVRDISGFERLATRARDMGCSISAVGVDVDYDERIMSALALSSNGRHAFVENPEDLPRMFDDELRSLVNTVATAGEMRIRLAPGVELLEVVDRDFRRDGDDLVVPVGSFSAGDEKTVLVKVRLPRRGEGIAEVADVRFGFDDLVDGGRTTCAGELRARTTTDPSAVSSLDPLVGSRLHRAFTATSLREANQLASKGDFSEARRRLRDAKRTVEKQKKVLAQRAGGARGRVADDFDRQIGALDEAEDNFASPPPAAGPVQAAPPRPQRAQIRRSEAAATDMML